MLEREQSGISPAIEATATAPPAADGRPVVEIVNPGGEAPLVLLCDHAGRLIPDWLGDLGLPEDELARQIGFDIGAAEVARVLAGLLDASAVLCHVSRLVIDPNRLPGDSASMKVSDGTVVPGNRAPGPEEERRRRLRLRALSSRGRAPDRAPAPPTTACRR